jgi:hypothetical protein
MKAKELERNDVIGFGFGIKFLSLDDKRALVVVLSFCGLERERDASAT